jgi:hypothetical protein
MRLTRVPAVVLVLVLAAGVGTTQASAAVTHEAKATKHGKKPKTKPKPKPKPYPNSAAHPVPLGGTANVDGWKIKVLSVAPEGADPALLTTVPAGFVWEVYSLQMTRTSSTVATPAGEIVEMQGASKTLRNVNSTPDCYGGSPGNDDVPKGSTVDAGACTSVTASDAAGKLVLYIGDAQHVWMAAN